MAQPGTNLVCCDIDADDNQVGLPACFQDSQGYQDSDGDGLVCDPDCTGGAESGCTTIPIDGGLSLLALAGGGLATAAMRRRREEEEAVQHVA